MPSSADPPAALVAAAEALEEGLRRLEELSASARKVKLHNEKGIARATKELQEAMQQPERITLGLRALAEAMAAMQARQQAALEPLVARAAEIQQRAALVQQHIHRYAALGAQAVEANQLLQSAAGKAPPPEVLADMDGRLTLIVDGAKALAEEARTEDLPEIARDAEALQQRIHAVRARLRSAGAAGAG